MNFTMKEIVSFVCENDVKFIRLAFCDLLGNFKNISILPSELEEAFDTGIMIDGSAINGFCDVEQSDVFLKPDPATITILPWRPIEGKVARFICDIYDPSGNPFVCDTRKILKKSIQKLYELDIDMQVGFESEFYLFKVDEKGNPTNEPIDNGGYLDMSPIDKGEDIRREICLTLEEMSMYPETSHHELGPGQNEIDFRYSDALSAADNFLAYKSVVQAIAQKNGMFANFEPKPFANKAGNGLHINISLYKNGENLFDEKDSPYKTEIGSFMSGVMAHADELSAVLNPIENSYSRHGAFEAPKFVSWGHNNRTTYFRIPATQKKSHRLELRASDNMINPYLALSAIIESGIKGIAKNSKIMAESKDNMYRAKIKNAKPLPKNLSDAIGYAEKSKLLKDSFGKETLKKYLELLNSKA